MARAFLIIVSLVLWFLPLIIATLYKLPHQGRIAVLSVALGWTGIAWLAALAIAVGGAIRATEPPAPGARSWADNLAPGRARAADRTVSPDRPGAPGQSEGPEQQSFPRVRSPWPGSER
jgi:hypothetical protein